MRALTVRKVSGWWLWYCQRPACLDCSGIAYGIAYGTASGAADAGRTH